MIIRTKCVNLEQHVLGTGESGPIKFYCVSDKNLIDVITQGSEHVHTYIFRGVEYEVYLTGQHGDGSMIELTTLASYPLLVKDEVKEVKIMNKIDWKRKLLSRKLWVAVGAFVSLLIVACGGTEAYAAQVVAIIMAGATVLGYIIGEGLVDAAAVDDGKEEKNEDREA